MRRTKAKPKPIKHKPGSGNVFADLGLADADELLVRAQIGYHVLNILENRTPRDIALLLGIAYSDVTHVMNGHFSRFSTGRLLDILNRAGWKATFKITPRRRGEPCQQVTFAR